MLDVALDAFSTPCVAEISMLPVVWLGAMTRLIIERRWTAKLSLARLQRDALCSNPAVIAIKITQKPAPSTEELGLGQHRGLVRLRGQRVRSLSSGSELPLGLQVNAPNRYYLYIYIYIDLSLMNGMVW